jgi:thioredoxin reductase (NADPH)
MPTIGKTKLASSANSFAEAKVKSETPIRTDALVIGAGPVGLFAVFQLGLLGVHAHVVDSLPHVGGQPAELYPDKPIYDIPGLPVSTGAGLAQALWQQTRPFAPQTHLQDEVSEVTALPEGRWLVRTASGRGFDCTTVFIAAGVGAFVPKTLTLPGIEVFVGHQLHYHRPAQMPTAGHRLLIMGDGDAALQAAIDAAHAGVSVTLMHRRDAFKAETSRVAELQALRNSGAVSFVAAQTVGFEATEGQLQALRVALPDGREARCAVDQVWALTGLSPKLGAIAHWGLAMERKQLIVNTEDFQTELPGVFAIGDINTYPGKKKLLVCGFHEATLAAYGAMGLITPGQSVPLQYTTTSTQLHARLGVSSPTKKP